MRLTGTYYNADELVKPIASPRAMMVVEVFKDETYPESRIMSTTVLGGPGEWDAIKIRKVNCQEKLALGPRVMESSPEVDSIVWCPPRSTPGSAEALITQPAAIALLMTDILGVAHVSWEQRKGPFGGDVTQYSLRLDDEGGRAKSPEPESLIDCLTMPHEEQC